MYHIRCACTGYAHSEFSPLPKLTGKDGLDNEVSGTPMMIFTSCITQGVVTLITLVTEPSATGIKIFD